MDQQHLPRHIKHFCRNSWISYSILCLLCFTIDLDLFTKRTKICTQHTETLKIMFFVDVANSFFIWFLITGLKFDVQSNRYGSIVYIRYYIKWLTFALFATVFYQLSKIMIIKTLGQLVSL